MGGSSSSKSSQTITNNTVNQNYMDTLNKTVMNSAVSTMVNNASTCSSSVNQNNSCDLSNATIAGNLDITGNQSNDAKVNFSCIQASQTSADMATSMMASMAAEMKALSGTQAGADLNTAAQASNTSGFGSTGGSSSSNSSANITNNVTNTTISHVENVFEQNLSNNFTANTVNECIGKTTQSNSISAAGATVGGNANVECFQANTLQQVQECKQLAEAVASTTQKTFQELGMTVEASNTTSSETKSSVSSKSETVATGPIQDLGNAVSGIIGSIGGLFGCASLAALGPILGPICSLCCCIICCCLLLVVGKSMMGSGGGQSMPSFSKFHKGGFDDILNININNNLESIPNNYILNSITSSDIF